MKAEMKILTGNAGLDATQELQAAVDATRPQVSALVIQVQALTVTDQPSNESAGAMLLRIQAGIKAVDAKFDPILKPLKEALDNARKLKKEISDPLEEAKEILRGKMSTWLQAERKKEQEEQRRRDEEAAKQRREFEAIERERRELEQEVAWLVSPSPVRPVPAPIFTSTDALPVKRIATALGTGARMTRKVIVTDLHALLSAAAEGTVPLEIFIVDEKAILGFDKEMPEWVKEWPGVIVEDGVSIISGSGGGRGKGKDN